MKLSVCLSGGGARGSFELGVLQYMHENNIDIENFSGSSIGSVIACSYASGVEPKKILEIFKTKELKDSIKFNYFLGGLLKIDEEAKIFKELFPIQNIEDIPKNVFVCIYDYKNKKIEYVNKGSVEKACLASTALIPVFRPIKLNGNSYIDGGLKDNLPITPLLNFENKILSIDLFPLKKQKNKSYEKASKTINPFKIIRNKIFEEMISNHLISVQKSDYYLTNEKLRGLKILSFENLDYGFNLGYETAVEFFNETKI